MHTSSAPARVMSVNCIHAVRGRISFDSAHLVSGVEIGTLPAGSFVMTATVHIVTAFTAGTTLSVGTAASAEGYATSTGITPTAAGVKTNLTGVLSGDTVTADVPVVVRIGGTTPTAGVAVIVLEFYPHVT